MKRLWPLLAIGLLAQTATPPPQQSIDLSIILQIVPVMISVFMLMLVIGIISGFFRSVGDMLRDMFR